MESIIQDIAILLVPMLLAITFHEVAHGWVADRLGDHTARLSGRLTFNPIKHLDIVGTAMFFITRMIGWAKPVPVNPANFKNPAKDMMWVAIAGPISNLFLAAISAGILRMILMSNILFDPSFYFIMKPIYKMLQASIYINVGLAVFNFIPIPPLDGSKVLMGLLSWEQAAVFARIEPYGFLILTFLIITDVIHIFLSPVVGFTVSLLIGGRF